jgi:acetylornithine deacetylase
MVGQMPWMDSALLASAGIETVVFGPSGAGAHANEEWVELESAVKLAEILAETAIRYC